MVPSRAKAPEQSGALVVRMRARIVRTVARSSAASYTRTKPPRFNVAVRSSFAFNYGCRERIF
jgi:hypothetical protein